jgi:hypothetical protein
MIPCFQDLSNNQIPFLLLNIAFLIKNKSNIKMIKSITLGALVLFIFLIIFLLTLNHLSPERFSNPINQSFNYQNEILKKKNSRVLSILLFGDSTAVRGYSPVYLQNFLSLANFMASPKEHYHSLKRFLKNNPAPECIFVSDSYNNKHKDLHGFWQYFVTNGFYGLAEIQDIMRQRKALGLKYLNNFQLTFKYYFYHKTKLANFSLYQSLKKLFYNRSKSHEKLMNTIRYYRGLLPKGTRSKDAFFNENFHAYLNEDFEVSTLNDLYFEKFLALLKNKKTRVYLILPPISESLWEKTNAKLYYPKMINHLKKRFSKFKKLFFINKIRIYPDFFFYNANHLNKIGSEQFTDQLYINCKQ